MDLFDLPSTLKHSNSLMAIGDAVDDDFFMFGVDRSGHYHIPKRPTVAKGLAVRFWYDESQLWTVVIEDIYEVYNCICHNKNLKHGFPH